MDAIQNLIGTLKSSQLEDKLRAIDQMVDIANLLAKESVKALEQDSGRLFIAERLHRFGSIVMPDLEDLFNKSEKEEVRILAALVLFQLGFRQGIPYLKEILQGSSEYVPLIALRLTETEEQEFAEVIINRLRSAQDAENDIIVALLSSLKNIKVGLPPDLKERFSSSDVPWQVRTMVESRDAEDHPAPRS